MKKTYIKPETVVVALNVKENLMTPSQFNPNDTEQMSDDDKFGAREVIKTQDPWEEW